MNRCSCFKEQSLCPESECPIVNEYIDNIVTEVMTLPYIKPQDTIVVGQLIRALGFLMIAQTYLNVVGTFKLSKDKKTGITLDTQPIIDRMARYENLVAKLADSLGLTPRARAALKLSEKSNLAKLIQEVEKKLLKGLRKQTLLTPITQDATITIITCPSLYMAGAGRSYASMTARYY